MPSERESAPASRTPDTHAAHESVTPLVESAAPESGPSGLALLGRAGAAERGNGPVRQAALLAAQRAAGNRAARRFVQRAPAAAPLPVQRDGTGLAATKVTGAFAAEAQAILDNWNNLKPRNRAWALAGAASVRLEALGAPRIVGDFGDARVMGPSSYGAFSPALWQITLNEAGFQDDCTAEQRARAVGTIYHEARHAEQYFRVARMLAGQGQPGADPDSEGVRIAKALGLRDDIAKAAARSPLSDPSKKKSKSKADQQEREAEYAEAQSWKDAMDRYHGKGGVLETLNEAQTRFYAARRARGLNPGDPAIEKEYREAWVATRGAYLTYQKLASVEADAWAAGGAVEKALGQEPNTAEAELAKMGADPRAAIMITAGQGATMPGATPSAATASTPVSPRAPQNWIPARLHGAQGPPQPGAQGPGQPLPPFPTLPGAQGPGQPLPPFPTLPGAQGPENPAEPRIPHKRIIKLPTGGFDPAALAAQEPEQPGAQGPRLGLPPYPAPLLPSTAPQGGLPGAQGPAPVLPPFPTLPGGQPLPGAAEPRIPHKRIIKLPTGGFDPATLAAEGPDQPGAEGPAQALPPFPTLPGAQGPAPVLPPFPALPGAQGPAQPGAQGPDQPGAQPLPPFPVLPGAQGPAQALPPFPALPGAQGPGQAGPRPPRNRIIRLPAGGLDPNAGAYDAPVQRHALPEELARVTQEQEIDPGAAGDS